MIWMFHISVAFSMEPICAVDRTGVVGDGPSVILPGEETYVSDLFFVGPRLVVRLGDHPDVQVVSGSCVLLRTWDEPAFPLVDGGTVTWTPASFYGDEPAILRLWEPGGLEPVLAWAPPPDTEELGSQDIAAWGSSEWLDLAAVNRTVQSGVFQRLHRAESGWEVTAQMGTGMFPGVWGKDTIDSDGTQTRFGRFADGTWSLVSSDPWAADELGAGPAIWADRAIATSVGGWEGNEPREAVLTYRKTCGGEWLPDGEIADPHADGEGSTWGANVAISGALLAVDSATNGISGTARVLLYRLQPDGTWVQFDEILDPDYDPTRPYEGDHGFAAVMKLSGNHLAVSSADKQLVYVYEIPPLDRDEDGFDESTDCDDLEADVHPGGVEVCNGLDDDCDGLVDGDECPADSVRADCWAGPPPAEQADKGGCGGGCGQGGAALIFLPLFRRRGRR